MGNAEQKIAYQDLLRRYLPALRRVAWSYAREPHQAEDLLQEIALALWTALPRFRGDASERTWLYRVAHNTAISFVTSHDRRAKREKAGEVPEVAALGGNPESGAIEEQKRVRLYRAVEDLSIEDRQLDRAVPRRAFGSGDRSDHGVKRRECGNSVDAVRRKLAEIVKGEDACKTS